MKRRDAGFPRTTNRHVTHSTEGMAITPSSSIAVSRSLRGTNQMPRHFSYTAYQPPKKIPHALAHRAVPTVNQWFQDHVQIGYTSMPVEEMHLTVRMPYGGQDQWPIANLLGADSGLFRFRDTVTHDGSNSGDFGGNLEVVPYSDEYLLGRILIGNTMKTKLADFLTAQEVQNPFSVDVNWLAVGHVDEIVGFAPGGTRGYKVVHASPDYAQQLLGRGVEPSALTEDLFYSTAPN